LPCHQNGLPPTTNPMFPADLKVNVNGLKSPDLKVS
jgi:hypothetical protein